MDLTLTCVAITCSLKPSPTASSTEKIADQLLDELRSLGATGESIRAVDYAIAPGVQTDMGEGDEWPKLREKVLAADIVILATPTWLGQHSSVAQRVLERLDAELSETDESGRPVLFDKVALAAIVGNEDGAHHIAAILFQALNDVGFTVPAQGSVYWNGEAMQGVDYQDLPQTPEKVAAALKTAAANAAHLARTLKISRYPS